MAKIRITGRQLRTMIEEAMGSLDEGQEMCSECGLSESECDCSMTEDSAIHRSTHEPAPGTRAKKSTYWKDYARQTRIQHEPRAESELSRSNRIRREKKADGKKPKR